MEMKRNHEATCAESVRRASQEERLTDDLVAIGPGVICAGEVVGVDASGWSIQVRHFIDGDPPSLIAFIDQFERSPAGDRYVLVNALGDGRVLLGAPALTKNSDGYLVKCVVAPSFPRIEAQRLGGEWAISPKTHDLYLDNNRNIARVSGIEALPQRVQSCLSMQRGESPFYWDRGVRIAQYFDAFRGSPWLAQLVKLEVIRQAAIPYHDALQKQDYTPLQCVERVLAVEAIAEVPENQWLPVKVVFDVRGVGRWQHELSICIPTADSLAKIQERQKTFAALRGHAEIERKSAVSALPVESTVIIKETTRDSTMEWDIFISHASEDKEIFVRPLAKRLQEQGLRVWFDELTLTVGDSLRRSIDKGLAGSRYGIVVISPDFLKKEWPQKELDGLVAREVEGIKVILPVWHNIGATEIRNYSPTLADRLAASSSKGLDHVTDQLLQAIRQSPSVKLQPQEVGRPATLVPTQDAFANQKLNDYVADFHRRSVAQLVAGKGPIGMLDGGALVMHVVPFIAVGDKSVAAFEEIARNPYKFLPMSAARGHEYRISYDGLLVGSNADGLSKPQRAFVAVSRSGAIEAVESSLARGSEHNFLQLPALQASVIKYACTYACSLGEFSILPPLAVCISLINVQGMKLLQDFIPRGAVLEDLPCGDLDRKEFDFGQVIFEAIPRDYNEGAKVLRPILEHLANAAGLHSSPYFDASGNYELADRL